MLLLQRHGDGVKDIAFEVENIEAVYSRAKANGGIIISPLSEVHDDKGFIKQFAIQSYGDTTHTIVQCRNDNQKTFQGLFLPGYNDIVIDDKNNGKLQDPLNMILKPVKFSHIDHCVGNQSWGNMEKTCKFYENVLGFHRFWSVDDKQIFTENSALKSIVMASPGDESIKMPINEPAKGLRRSQVEEFIEYYEGAGVQHIALLTHDIVKTVDSLKTRGVEFINVPATYYQDIRKQLFDNGLLSEAKDTTQDNKTNVIRSHNGFIDTVPSSKLIDKDNLIMIDTLNDRQKDTDNPENRENNGNFSNLVTTKNRDVDANTKVNYHSNQCCTKQSESFASTDKSKTPGCYCYKIQESIKEIENLNLLIDFDENGYLLQIFTKPLTNRPTIFLEIIQRMNHNGFGVGNFRSLFEAIERGQVLRGNL